MDFQVQGYQALEKRERERETRKVPAKYSTVERKERDSRERYCM
jgi:hypothetical protein